MESTLFDNVHFEKEKAIAKFYGFRRIVRLRQLFEVLVCFGLISWSSAQVPAILKVSGRCVVEISAFLFNHHVVFVIGNVIIVSLFVICRKSDSFDLSVSNDDTGDDFVKHSAVGAVNQREASPPQPAPVTEIIEAAATKTAVGGSGGGDEEKQIVVRTEFDEMAIAIEKATRQIRRFQRTQSEKLKREIAVRPRTELRRSETDIFRQTADPGDHLGTGEIETLSSEDFRLTIEAFIDKHWSRKNEFEKYDAYPIVQMA